MLLQLEEAGSRLDCVPGMLNNFMFGVRYHVSYSEAVESPGEVMSYWCEIHCQVQSL